MWYDKSSMPSIGIAIIENGVELYYTINRLMMGARPAPKCMNQTSKALVWLTDKTHDQKFTISIRLIALILSYVDDFLCLGISQEDCQQRTNALFHTADRMGLVFKKEKAVPPGRVREFCGLQWHYPNHTIEIAPNTHAKTLFKMLRIYEKNGATIQYMESTKGSLHYIAPIIPPFKIFINAIDKKLTYYKFTLNKKPNEWWSLTKSESDMLYIATKLLCEHKPHDWDDIAISGDMSIFQQPKFKWLVIYTDACTSYALTGAGGGICTSTGDWIFYKFPKHWIKPIYTINTKEADAAYRTLYAMRHIIQGRHVQLFIDNSPVHHGIIKKKYNNPEVADTIKCINELEIALSTRIYPR